MWVVSKWLVCTLMIVFCHIWDEAVPLSVIGSEIMYLGTNLKVCSDIIPISKISLFEGHGLAKLLMQSVQHCTDYRSETEKNTLYLVCNTDSTNNMYEHYYKQYGSTKMIKADYYNVSNSFKNHMENHNYDFERNLQCLKRRIHHKIYNCIL